MPFFPKISPKESFLDISPPDYVSPPWNFNVTDMPYICALHIRSVRFLSFQNQFLSFRREISPPLWICITIWCIAIYLEIFWFLLIMFLNFLCRRQTHLFLGWSLGIWECRVHALLDWLCGSQAGSGEQMWSLLCRAPWPLDPHLSPGHLAFPPHQILMRVHFPRHMIESPSVIPNLFVICAIKESNIYGFKAKTGIWKGRPILESIHN